ncbi:MAG: RNA 2',3'-cyclic phosphodiesterase [Massilia sp.]
MSTDTARLFIALWPDDEVRAGLRAWRDGWRWPKQATPVRSERLHMTLHFLGGVPRDQIDLLADRIALPFEPFTMDFGQPELWPHGIAVLAPVAVPAPLLRLQRELGERLQAAGLTLDARDYRAHVTMARRAAGALMPPDGPPIRWSVASYALMESAADGYRVLRTYA